MALQVNDWIWLRLSSRYGVSPAEAQVGDVFKRWLDERGGTWGYSLVDFYFGKTTLPTSYADAEYAYWSGGALKDAAFWIDAFSASGTSVTNLGSGGSALNARYGSTTGVDIADPVLLTHTGTNYLYLPGGTVSANFASAPNGGTSLGGDVSLAVRYDPTDRNDNRTLLLKRQSGVDTNFYPFNFGQWTAAGGGSLYFGWSDTTGAVHTLYGTVLVPATAKWVGVQHDMDNGTGGNTAHFYWSSDATNPTWTLLESVTEAFVDPAGRRVNAAQIGVGGTDVGQHGAVGKYYEAKVWSGLTFSSAPLFHANFTTGITSGSQVTFTESSVNAATVTINRSLSGRKSVAVVRPVWLFGTDDFMEAAADPYGAYVRTGGTSAAATGTHVSYDTGTATAGAATTLDDTAKAWTTSTYISRVVRITGGTGVGQVRVITANTATQLTVSPAWTTTPDATSTYVIESRGNVNDDLEIVVRVALDNWITGFNQPLVSKRTIGQYSYYAYISATGSIALSASTDGTNATINFGSVVAPFTNGTPYWIRIRRTASTGTIVAYYAADQPTEPTLWTTLSSNTLTAGNLWQGTADIGIGGSPLAGWTYGRYFSVIVRDGFGGNAAAYWLAYGHPAGGNYVNANRVLWTLGANASAVNPNPLNFGANDSYTVVSVQRTWATPATSGTIVSKWSGGGGYNVRNGFGTPTQPLIALNDNNTSQAFASSTPTLGAATVLAWVVEPTQVTNYTDNTVFGPAARTVFEGSASEVPFRLGSTAASSSYNDFELLAVAVIPKALTAADIAKIVAAYQ